MLPSAEYKNYKKTRSVMYIWDTSNVKCLGRLQRGVCLPSVEGLATVLRSKAFFFNKMGLHYDPIAYQCAEEWYLNKTLINNAIVVDDYCRLEHVANHTSYKRCAEFHYADEL